MEAHCKNSLAMVGILGLDEPLILEQPTHSVAKNLGEAQSAKNGSLKEAMPHFHPPSSHQLTITNSLEPNLLSSSIKSIENG